MNRMFGAGSSIRLKAVRRRHRRLQRQTSETINLSLHAELAFDYFQLHGLDAEKQLLDSDRHRLYTGAATDAELASTAASRPKSDVAQAQTQLETVRAQADRRPEVDRAQLEHAVAILAAAKLRPTSACQVAAADDSATADSNWAALRTSRTQTFRHRCGRRRRRIAAANAEDRSRTIRILPDSLPGCVAPAGFEGQQHRHLALGLEPVLVCRRNSPLPQLFSMAVSGAAVSDQTQAVDQAAAASLWPANGAVGL